jgi:hypothetical protein
MVSCVSNDRRRPVPFPTRSILFLLENVPKTLSQKMIVHP